MSFNGDENKWICGVGAVSLKRVSSIVRDIGEPCLHHSPAKGTKMLKPDKWQTIFDNEGRVMGFKNVLKLIVLGGVDRSIRAEVWEFLLGCYALGTTAEYRRQLRMVRRERYMDLIKQCQKMHPTIGSGSLAYAVGCKVMDVRTVSRDKAAGNENGSSSHMHNNNVIALHDQNDDHADGLYACLTDSSSDFDDLVNVRESTDSPAYANFPFPLLPITDLFQKNNGSMSHSEQFHDRHLADNSFRCKGVFRHSFQVNNNVDLVMESNGSSSNGPCYGTNVETPICSSSINGEILDSADFSYKATKMGRLRLSDIPDSAVVTASSSNGLTTDDDKISEWLWTLHQIVVDVVRTDNHLEFYNDAKNMARMSDILAIYAWVDPATGYCQGMSDLLSPFVVLFEDNADAFWCFEMLLRRMRENFQLEGPIGVIKQLQALWKILELIDTAIFTHLSLIGAESLHFAFRMLLVLFRRELSFNEALCMWEMIWAADFSETAIQELEMNCPDQLVIQLPRYSDAAHTVVGCDLSGNKRSEIVHVQNRDLEPSQSCDNKVKFASKYPLCGLATASFWAREDHAPVCSVGSSARNSDDELPVFCVAAILIINRHLILRETHSLDDLIKMFNDKVLKINVKKCIRTAMKLRKKYLYRLVKQAHSGGSENGAP